MYLGAILGLVSVLVLLLNLKTSRPDGTIVAGVHKYRRMMFHIMPGRNEAIVYYDTYARADALLAYLERVNQRFHCDVTHLLVGAAALGFIQNPKMNRFVAGRRLYQRSGDWITFSMKRRKKDAEAKLAAVKLSRREGETFEQLCLRIGGEIDVQRSDKQTAHDKEYDLLTMIPRPLLAMGVRFFKWLDYHNILPGSFIAGDPMYTGLFIANLGSLQMGPGFHHLFEWGTCPLFLMVGQIEERALVIDGAIRVEKVLPLRWSYDERIDDGLSSRRGILALNAILERPAEYLGCVESDGSDHFAIGTKRIPEDQLRVR